MQHTFSTEMYCLPSSVTNSWSKLAAMRAFKLSLGCAAGAAWQRLGSVRRWGRTGRAACGDEIACRGACERYAEAATCSGADSACRRGRRRRRWRPACSAAAGRCAPLQPCVASSVASQRVGQPLLRALRPCAPRTLSTCRLPPSDADRNSKGMIGTTVKARKVCWQVPCDAEWRQRAAGGEAACCMRKAGMQRGAFMNSDIQYSNFFPCGPGYSRSTTPKQASNGRSGRGGVG